MFTPNAFRNLVARARLLKGAFGVHPRASVAEYSFSAACWTVGVFPGFHRII
jgi:hypothetical protein